MEQSSVECPGVFMSDLTENLLGFQLLSVHQISTTFQAGGDTEVSLLAAVQMNTIYFIE